MLKQGVPCHALKTYTVISQNYAHGMFLKEGGGHSLESYAFENTPTSHAVSLAQ